jgi:hypothetical protein
LKRFVYIFIALALNSAVFANNNTGEKMAKSEMSTFSGKIIDNTGEEVVGAKIQIKGTSEVFYSDLNGNFSFELPATENTSIVVEQLGFSPAKINTTELKQFAEIKLSEL